MRLRDRREFSRPEVNIIPMIDIIFFLLVFFMMSTLYMVNLKTVDIDMPKAQNAETRVSATFVVTMKKDGTLWLEDRQVTQQELLSEASVQQKRDSKFAVVLRAEQDMNYGKVIELLDMLKGEGIVHIGLAADSTGEG